MTAVRATHSSADITPIFEKRAVFFGAARRDIDSTPESMRQTPRLPASIGHSSE